MLMTTCIDTREKADMAINELLNRIDSTMFRMIREETDICLLELSYFDCCFIRHCIELLVKESDKKVGD